MPLRALLDTGAQMCLISESVANRLLQDGNASMKYTDRNERFVMADGSVSSLPVILIHEMRIGSHVVRNVRAAVTAAGGMIVAFPVVNDIAPFTIDTRAGELIFHTTANS